MALRREALDWRRVGQGERLLNSRAVHFGQFVILGKVVIPKPFTGIQPVVIDRKCKVRGGVVKVQFRRFEFPDFRAVAAGIGDFGGRAGISSLLIHHFHNGHKASQTEDQLELFR
jgi:hypothetical protein